MNKRKKLELQWDYLKFKYTAQNDYRAYRQIFLLSIILLVFSIESIIISNVSYTIWIIIAITLILFLTMMLFENYHQSNGIADTKKKLQEIYLKLSK